MSQVFERRGRGYHYDSAIARDLVDRLLHAAHKKSDAKNPLKTRWLAHPLILLCNNSSRLAGQFEAARKK
jgi:hypothetical protein